MPDRKHAAELGIGGVLLGALILPFSLIVLGGSSQAACNPAQGSATSVMIDPTKILGSTIGGYGHDQLVNAAYVIQAGKDLKLGVRDQAIGVMTAMGESGLRVLDHGDTAGPDSRGLFQQRAGGAWGSYADRMDPYISSTNFFTAMMTLAGRDSLEPTIVAHRTQRNADPYYYTRYWGSAVAVVEGLSGVDTGLNAGAGNQVCTSSGVVPGSVSKSGWALPGTGPITSPYGMRIHPVTGERRLHSGTDLHAGGCDGPIWAAQAGVVIKRGNDSSGNGIITLDHGGGVQTSYLHMYDSGMLADVGDQVKAGQQIARVGSSGTSTGCHLHFMVVVNGDPIDPVPFMAAVGINLGR